jgi:hypothetical protein
MKWTLERGISYSRERNQRIPRPENQMHFLETKQQHKLSREEPGFYKRSESDSLHFLFLGDLRGWGNRVGS